MTSTALLSMPSGRYVAAPSVAPTVTRPVRADSADADRIAIARSTSVVAAMAGYLVLSPLVATIAGLALIVTVLWGTELSLPTGLGPEGLFALGRALAPLRRSGVVFFCSGNLTHGITGEAANGAQAREFDAWAVEAIGAGDFDALIDAPNKAPAFVLNHPSDEHWLPILVAAGASSAWSEAASYPVEGFEGENISQRCVRWG